MKPAWPLHLVLLGVGAGCGVVRLAATEFDLLANDTYLSPGVLASVNKSAGQDSRASFCWSSAAAAVESGYAFRDNAARTASLVGALTTDYYTGNWQLGGSAEHRTRLGGDDAEDGVIPRERYRLYLARYVPFASAEALEHPGGRDLRLLGGWRGDRLVDGAFVSEAFCEVTVKLLPERYIERKTFIKDVTGSYLYAWRPGRNEHFLGYNFRATILRRHNGLSLRYLLSLGAQRRRADSYWAEVQNGVVFWYQQRKTHLLFELSFATTRDLRRDTWNNQVMFTLKRDLVAKIIRD